MQGAPHSQPNLDTGRISEPWALRFWVLTVMTGIASGIAGGLLMRLLRVVEQATWQYHAGTLMEAAGRASATRHLVALLLAGVLVGSGGWLIRRTLGRGGDVEAAVWFRSGYVPGLVTIARSLHTIVTVGLGTSLGRESPIKEAGGAIASRFADWGSLSRPQRRLLGACGVGAGMAAAYNVPVGGALFAIEVLLGSISLRLAMPALLCSGVATAASWALLPTEAVYRVPEYPLSMSLTFWALAAGPVLGLATVPLVRAIGWAGAHRPQRTLPVLVFPILVLAALGAISIPYPQVIGNGKDVVQLAFADQFPFALLLILPVLKLLSTAGCLGSGATGGVFTPTMTIGALAGGLLGHLWDHLWPGASMGSCSVIGACAFLAAASQGPVSALVLVLELTRHVDATMVPMLLAVAMATLVARAIEARSIYSIRLPRNDPADAPRLPFEPLVSRDFPAVSAAAAYAEVARQLLTSPQCRPIYVLDQQGVLIGQISPEHLGGGGVIPIEASQAGDLAVPSDAVTSAMTEPQILARIEASGQPSLPLLDPATRRMIGIISRP